MYQSPYLLLSSGSPSRVRAGATGPTSEDEKEVQVVHPGQLRAPSARYPFLPRAKSRACTQRNRSMASSPLTHRALQHHASRFSIRGNMHPAELCQEEADPYHDDGLTPRALNIRRPLHLGENVPSPTRRHSVQSESSEQSQDSTPRGPLRVMNPDIDVEYRDHRRAAIYVVSRATLLRRT